MEDTTSNSVLERLKIAADSDTDLDLSKKLGLSKQAVADAKSKKNVPTSWIPKAAKLFGVSTDWLFFGTGSMRHEDPVSGQQQSPEQAVIPIKTVESYSPCAEIKAELEEERRERRELSAELRKVNAENRHLLKENGDLRERCATLEERQKICCPEELHQTTQATPFNDAQLRA